jgi:hypothetical protein
VEDSWDRLGVVIIHVLHDVADLLFTALELYQCLQELISNWL